MNSRFKRKIRKAYPESKSVIKEIERHAKWIKRYDIPVLKNPRPLIEPSVPFRSKIIYFTSLLRLLELTCSFVRSFNRYEFLACALLSRSACELGAYIYFVNEKLNYHLTNSDWPTINGVLDRFLVGSRAVGDTMPVGSGDLIRKIRGVVPQYAEAYDDLCEIVHFNVGGKAYYQEIIDDEYVRFRLPKRFEEGDERLLLNPIISSLAIIRHLEKPFLKREFPKRLIPGAPSS